MNFDRTTLKSNAKVAIKGNIATYFVATIIVAAITGIAGVIPVLGAVAWIFVTLPFQFSFVLMALKMVHGQKLETADAFSSFNGTYYLKSIGVYLLVGIFTALWSLLLVVPGIIKGLSYSQAPYILAENPQMDIMECIDASKQIMDGHKMDLFLLQLSFIGWFFLCSLTFGIALIYVNPYYNATVANFYEALKAEKSGAAAM